MRSVGVDDMRLSGGSWKIGGGLVVMREEVCLLEAGTCQLYTSLLDAGLQQGLPLPVVPSALPSCAIGLRARRTPCGTTATPLPSYLSKCPSNLPLSRLSFANGPSPASIGTQTINPSSAEPRQPRPHSTSTAAIGCMHVAFVTCSRPWAPACGIVACADGRRQR
ncbi:uncharacterized protein CC84DRAFT_1164831, partial [Paraphaeosphaeria sporulosa]